MLQGKGNSNDREWITKRVEARIRFKNNWNKNKRNKNRRNKVPIKKRDSQEWDEARQRYKESLEKHVQIIIYENILSGDHQYDQMTKEEIDEKRKLLRKLIPSLSDKVKRAAQFNLAFFSILLDENNKSPLKLIDDTGFFDWPDTGQFREGRGEQHFSTAAEIEGLLGKLGYNVQKDGPPKTARQRILARFFLGESRPPKGVPEALIREWGDPLSSTRLRKVAYSIAWFARQQKGRPEPSLQAISKWESDLEFLKDEYYAKFHTNFLWPST